MGVGLGGSRRDFPSRKTMRVGPRSLTLSLYLSRFSLGRSVSQYYKVVKAEEIEGETGLEPEVWYFNSSYPSR